MDTPSPLGRATVDAAALAAKFPPRLTHRNKRAVYETLCPPGHGVAGTMVVSRWAQEAPPGDLRWADAATAVTLRPDAFDYAPAQAGAVEWHLNFAHTVLFVAYGGALFAQDEMQVAEHPALGSLREWLTTESVPGLRPVTRESGAATPVLIRGVERRGAVATDADLEADRPYGLYGNAFGRAKEAAVRRATRVIDPPTLSNLIAMEAPPGGAGEYTAGQIGDVLATAYTGFRAARAESGGAAAVVHTGHWGTGAYGGDRVLMAMLQVLAARAAGVERVVFHAYDEAGMAPCTEALARLGTLERAAPTVAAAAAALAGMGFVWGLSDGN